MLESAAAWNVPTVGRRVFHRAMSGTLGISGSWRWTTSGSKALSARRTPAAVRGPNESGATEPFAGTLTARPTR
jgi:hypothetical protein